MLPSLDSKLFNNTSKFNSSSSEVSVIKLSDLNERGVEVAKKSLIAINESVGWSHYTKGLLSSFNPNNDTIFLAVKDNQIIGYVTTQKYKDEHHLYVPFLAVDQTKQGSAGGGAALKLMQEVINMAKDNQISKLTLHYRGNKERTKAFYEKLGKAAQLETKDKNKGTFDNEDPCIKKTYYLGKKTIKQPKIPQQNFNKIEKNLMKISSTATSSGIIEPKSEKDIVFLSEAKMSINKNMSNYLDDNKDKFPEMDEKIVVEIVKLCINKNPMLVAYRFKDFGIKDPSLTKKLVTQCFKGMDSSQIEKFLRFTFDKQAHFKDLEIDDPSFYLEIANLCVKKHNARILLDIPITKFFEYFGIQDRENKQIIMEACLKDDPIATLRNLKLFEINGMEEIYKVAEKCAKMEEWAQTLPFFIQHKGCVNAFLSKDRSLIDVIKSSAQSNLEQTLQNFENFELNDPKEIFKIAEYFMKLNPSLTARYFQSFKITDPAEIFTLAKLWAENKDKNSRSYFENFHLKDPAHIEEIAKQYAKNQPHMAANMLHKLNLEESVLIQIAKICMAQDPQTVETVWDRINKIKIEDQATILEIANMFTKLARPENMRFLMIPLMPSGSEMLLTKETRTELLKLFIQNADTHFFNQIQGEEGIKKFLEHFKVESLSDRLEIAKTCIGRGGTDFINDIEHFGITKGSSEAIEITKIFAQYHGEACAKHFIDFGIKDPKIALEIATLCIQSTGRAAKYLDHFGITDPSVKFELAKMCAKSNGESCAENFADFDIKDPKLAFEIIKLCIRNTGLAAKYLDRFGITDPSVKFELAKMCAEHSAESCVENFKYFGIIEHKDILTIAMICAKHAPLATAEKLGSFGLTESNDILVIAKICSNKKPETSPLFLKYFLEDKLMQFEILKISAETMPFAFALHMTSSFEAFELTDQKKILELAKICMSNSGGMALSFIKNFQLNEKDELEVFYTALHAGAGWESGSIKNLKNYENKDDKILLLSEFLELSEKPVNFEASKQKLQKYIEISLKSQGFESKSVFESISKIKDPFEKMQALIWFGQTCFVMHMKLDAKEIKWISDQKLLEGFSNFKSPELRNSLMFSLSSCNDSICGLYEKREKDLTPLEKETGRIHGNLIRYAICTLIDSGIEEETILSVIQKLKNKKFFNDQKKFLVFTETLFLLNEQSLLDKNTVQEILKNLKTKKEDLYALNLLLKLNYITEIKEGLKEKKSFEKILHEIFFEILPLGHVESLQEKFANTFGKSRMPDAIIRYTTAFKRLGDPSITACIGRFVESVINGDFIKQRNSLENNPHLSKIFEKDRAPLHEKWTTPLKGNVLNDGSIAVDTEDPYDLLLSGTEVSGSCQSIDGTPMINKGLLGTIMDGKTRLLAIKDQNGKILTRALLRILWDGKQPVLFLEPVYSSKQSEEHNKEIFAMAQQKAQALGVPLLTKMFKDKPYSKPIEALGGPTPYDYSDGVIEEGVIGLVLDGKFTIKDPCFFPENI